MTEREGIPCFTFYFIRILKNKIHFFSTTTEKETIPYLTFSIKIPDDGGGEGNSIFYIFLYNLDNGGGEGNSIFYVFLYNLENRGGEGNSILYIFLNNPDDGEMTGKGKKFHILHFPNHPDDVERGRKFHILYFPNNPDDGVGEGNPIFHHVEQR